MIQKNTNGGDSHKIQETSKNHTSRVGEDFNNWVLSINKERKENDLKTFSMNVLTNLLIKHKTAPGVREDLIRFDLKNGK